MLPARKASSDVAFTTCKKKKKYRTYPCESYSTAYTWVLQETALRSDRPHINHSLLSRLFVFFSPSSVRVSFFIILAKRLPKHGFLMDVGSPIQIDTITIVQSAYYKMAHQHQFFTW